jgi:hypothetical protein
MARFLALLLLLACPIFPQIYTDSQLLRAVNNSQARLSAAITAGTTTLTFPTSTTFVANSVVTIDNEIILLGTKATTTVITFTGCTRGYDSTTAAAHNSNSLAQSRIVAAHHNNMVDAVEAIGSNVAGILSGSSARANTYYQWIRAVSTSVTPAAALGQVAPVNFTTLPTGVLTGLHAYPMTVTAVGTGATYLGHISFRVTVTNAGGVAGAILNDDDVIILSGITGTGGCNTAILKDQSNTMGVWRVRNVAGFPFQFDLYGSTAVGSCNGVGTATRATHFIDVSGGTGQSEAAPIVGGSGITPLVYFANSHSGVTTYSSATSGVQEGYYAGAAILNIPVGTYTQDAETTIGYDQLQGAASGLNIVGQLAQSSIFIRGARFIGANADSGVSNVGGIMFRVEHNARFVFSQASIYNYGNGATPYNLGTQSAAISFQALFSNDFCQVKDSYFINEYVGTLIKGANQISILDNVYYAQPGYEQNSLHGYAFIWLPNSPYSSNAKIVISGNTLNATDLNDPSVQFMQNYGIRIEQSDGVLISGNEIAAKHGLGMVATGTNNLNYVTVQGNTFDQSQDSAIFIVANVAGVTAFGNIDISGNLIQTSRTTGNALIFITGPYISSPGIKIHHNIMTSSYAELVDIYDAKNLFFDDNRLARVNFSLSAGVDAITINTTATNSSFSRNNITCSNDEGGYAGTAGIHLNTGTSASRLTINGNQIRNCGSGIWQEFACTGCVIANNTLTDHSTYGLRSDADLPNGSISGNTFYNNTTASMGLLGTYTTLTLGPNSYQESANTTIASAATITLPTTGTPGCILISGVTNIATINTGWSNRQVCFKMAGILTFTGGNIGQAFGPTTANQVVYAYYDAAAVKWWLK